jgi:hypothetical protein
VPENSREASPHVLAFYLPQFHQVPENDSWHGSGFTEWTVVARSRPLFPGHRQPELPGELGFYDLRVPETRYLQARLAREHGISGFLYYHYWFSGRRMLGRPLDEVLASGRPDFPFALCWANESWYRRWQGTVDEMLVEQTFSEEDDLDHIRWLIECFKDPRYIRIAGRPLLTVYRAQLLPDPSRTVALWRTECERAGVEPPWLVSFETGDDMIDPASIAFDASAEFVPHFINQLGVPAESPAGSEGSHTVFRYEDVAAGYCNRPLPEWRRYPCVAAAWDNSPRRQSGEALILRDSTPEKYGKWLAKAAGREMQQSDDEGIVFLNAWNEWAEGAHLEPDAFWGRAYLDETKRVLEELFGSIETDLPHLASDDAEPRPIEDLYHDLYEQFVALETKHSGFVSYEDRRRRDLRSNYDAYWQEQRDEIRALAELNKVLVEQMESLLQKMRESGMTDIPTPSWLVTP